MAEAVKPMIGSSKKEAERVAADQRQAASLLADAMRKAEQQEGRLQRVWSDLQALLRLVRAWVQGGYRQVPWKTIVLALAALIYFVNPLDVIPDALLGLGYLDDATVIAWVIRSVKQDMDRFLEWENAEQQPPAGHVTT